MNFLPHTCDLIGEPVRVWDRCEKFVPAEMPEEEEEE